MGRSKKSKLLKNKPDEQHEAWTTLVDLNKHIKENMKDRRLRLNSFIGSKYSHYVTPITTFLACYRYGSPELAFTGGIPLSFAAYYFTKKFRSRVNGILSRAISDEHNAPTNKAFMEQLHETDFKRLQNLPKKDEKQLKEILNKIHSYGESFYLKNTPEQALANQVTQSFSYEPKIPLKTRLSFMRLSTVQSFYQHFANQLNQPQQDKSETLTKPEQKRHLLSLNSIEKGLTEPQKDRIAQKTMRTLSYYARFISPALFLDKGYNTLEGFNETYSSMLQSFALKLHGAALPKQEYSPSDEINHLLSDFHWSRPDNWVAFGNQINPTEISMLITYGNIPMVAASGFIAARLYHKRMKRLMDRALDQPHPEQTNELRQVTTEKVTRAFGQMKRGQRRDVDRRIQRKPTGQIISPRSSPENNLHKPIWGALPSGRGLTIR